MVNKSASRDALTSTRSTIVRNVSMPIYLYVKTHNQTGLKYLGKTTASDPHSYPGSGVYWSHHLKEHGKDYSTEILFETNDLEELKTVGRYYSNLWNVVKSNNWANLKPEDGDGWPTGDNHHSRRPGYINPAKLPANRKQAEQRMKTLGDRHWSKTEKFKTNMSGDRNPAHLPHVKERMIKQNPRLLDHNRELWRQRFLEDNPMARTEVVEKITGKNHYLHDPTIRSWKNLDTGKIVLMTRDELAKSYDLNPGDVGRVILGKRRQTKGWSLDE